LCITALPKVMAWRASTTSFEPQMSVWRNSPFLCAPQCPLWLDVLNHEQFQSTTGNWSSATIV
jgi:hypothetical protein